MIILLLFNLIRPPIPPITDTDLIAVESLTGYYQQRLDQSIKIASRHPAIFNFGNYLVFGYKPHQLARTETFIKENRGKIIKISQTGGNYLFAHFPDATIEDNLLVLTKAQSLPFIRYCEPSIKLRKCFIPNDPYFSNYQWDKWVMYSDLIWDITFGSIDVTIAICDQGVDYRHPDLSPNFNLDLLGYDFVDNDPDPYPNSPEETHGTHVAGIIGAVINNGIGIAGWASVRLLSIRVLNEEGSGWDFDIAEGIRWATNIGAKIINLSLGSYEYSSVLAEAVEYAWNNGVLLFAATGNDGINEIYYPAKFDRCVAIGALDQNNRIASFSNYGRQQELVGPGVDIISTINNNRYAIYNGTSMACPQASGVAGLILSLFPNLSNQRLRAILDVSTIDLGANGKDNIYGYGLLSAYRAYSLAQILATSDKSKNKDKSKILIQSLKHKNIAIFNVLGRRIEKIGARGIYFCQDRQKIKKLVVHRKVSVIQINLKPQ
ncbi:MAG: S8 family peptidase [candidate division WOR-3 bacterium]